MSKTWLKMTAWIPFVIPAIFRGCLEVIRQKQKLFQFFWHISYEFWRIHKNTETSFVLLHYISHICHFRPKSVQNSYSLFLILRLRIAFWLNRSGIFRKLQKIFLRFKKNQWKIRNFSRFFFRLKFGIFGKFSKIFKKSRKKFEMFD